MAKLNFGDIPKQSDTLNFGDIPASGGTRSDTVDFGDIPSKQEASLGGFAKQFRTGFVDEALLGFPLKTLKDTKGEEAVKAQESQVPIERFGRGLGRVGASFVPITVFNKFRKAAQFGGKAVLGADRYKKINRFVRSAAETGVGVGGLELVQAPQEDFKEKIVSVPTSAIFGAGLGAAGSAIAPRIQSFLRSKGLINKGRVEGTENLAVLNKILDGAKNTVDEPVKMKVSKIKNTLRTEVLDRHSLIRDKEELVIENIGRKLPFKESVKNQLDRWLGVQGIVESTIKRYGSEIKKNKVNVDTLGQLKLAQRLRERALRGFENPGKVDVKRADAILKDLKDQLGDVEFNKLAHVAEQHRRMLRKILAKAKDSGFMDQKTFDGIVKNNQFYSPFEVLDFMAENSGNIGVGKGFNVAMQGALKATKGTNRQILDPINAEIRYMTRMLTALEKNSVKRKFFNLANIDKSLRSIMQPVSGKTKNVDIPKGFKRVSVFENGVKRDYMVEENIANVLNGMDTKAVDLMTKMASKFSRMLRAGATQFNVAFTIPNIFRDFQQAKLTSGIGFSVADLGRGVFSVLKKDNFYDQWLRQGGGFSGIVQSLRRTTPANLAELDPSISRQVLTNLNPFKWLAQVSSVAEQSTRVGVFRRALRQGLSVPEAVSISRNATIDFNRMGNTMQIANLWVPFLNARLQGTVNVLRAFKKDPKKFAYTATGIIAMPQIVTHAWNTAQFPDVWDDIRQFEKDQNFIFIYGREKDRDGRWLNVSKIPKGDVGKVIGNPIENALEFARGNDPDWQKVAIKTLSDILPVDIEREGELSPSALLSSVSPPPIKAAAEAATGVNLFTGRDIVKPRFKDAPVEEQFDIDTSPLAVQIGKFLNVSPFHIENLAGTLGGGLGRQLVNPLEAEKGIGRRFTGAFGREEQSVMFDMLADIEMDTNGQRAKDTRFLNQALKDWNELEPIPNVRRNFVIDRFSDNKGLLKKFEDLVVAGETGEEPIHRKLRASTIGDRLRFIRAYANERLDTPEDKARFLMDSLLKKVITIEGIKRFMKESGEDQ